MNRHLIATAMAVLMPLCPVLADDAARRSDTDETIAYLLAFVAKSDCTFIRNGRTYSGKDAAAHMNRKYRHFKDQIKTPEDFIRLAATKSLQSGRPYMVRTKDGLEVRCAEWVAKALAQYRKARTIGPGREGGS